MTLEHGNIDYLEPVNIIGLLLRIPGSLFKTDIGAVFSLEFWIRCHNPRSGIDNFIDYVTIGNIPLGIFLHSLSGDSIPEICGDFMGTGEGVNHFLNRLRNVLRIISTII